MNDTSIDEYPIRDIPAVPLWSENYALVAVDAGHRASFFYSIGRWYADPTVWRENVIVSFGDGGILFARNYGRNASQAGPGASCSRFEVLEPGKRLKLSYDGPLWESTSDRLLAEGAPEAPAGRGVLDLTFAGTTPIWNMAGDSKGAASMAGSLHIEQIGKAHGALEFAGRSFRFADCYTIRDHSRGVRDPSPFKAHCWINGALQDGRSFYLYAMMLQGSDTMNMANAVIMQGNEIYPAKVMHTEFLNGTADARKLHKVVLTSAAGQLELRAVEVLTSIPMSFVKPFDTFPGAARCRPAAQMYDEAIRLDCNGVGGIGWSERGFTAHAL